MSVKVLFLGRLSAIVAPERDYPAPLNWRGLLDSLPEEARALVAGGKVRVALDGALLADKTSMMAQSGAEVALLPPVSGG